MGRRDAWAAGGRAAIQKRQERHDNQVLGAILSCRKDGLSYREIAARLDLGFDPPGRARGIAHGPWSGIAVKRILGRHTAAGRQLDLEDAIRDA